MCFFHNQNVIISLNSINRFVFAYGDNIFYTRKELHFHVLFRRTSGSTVLNIALHDIAVQVLALLLRECAGIRSRKRKPANTTEIFVVFAHICHRNASTAT
jgi:hypothetical protein